VIAHAPIDDNTPDTQRGVGVHHHLPQRLPRPLASARGDDEPAGLTTPACVGPVPAPRPGRGAASRGCGRGGGVVRAW
jgi:hypothetical protein